MRVPAPIVIQMTTFGRKAKFCLSPGIRQLADNRWKEGVWRAAAIRPQALRE